MKEFDKLIDIVTTLRSQNGCPWDKKQTKESLLPYLVEELYEFMDAIDQEESDEAKKELGDLFLHLVFQGIIAEEKAEFNIADSLKSINNKLISRHPHVFGNAEVLSDDEMNIRWEQQKMKEGRKHVLDGIPKALPSLQKSYRIQEKASAAGFDWENIDGVNDKIQEELLELHEAKINGNQEEIIDEMGDVLFSIVNLCRWLRINPDEALRKANNKFTKRFNTLEKDILSQNKSFQNFTLDELEELWQKNKRKK